MGDIHFDTDQDTFDRAPVGSGEKADLVGWMMQKGIAKNEQQAQYALVGVVVASLILSLFFWRTLMGETSAVDISRLVAPPPSPAQIK